MPARPASRPLVRAMACPPSHGPPRASASSGSRLTPGGPGAGVACGVRLRLPLLLVATLVLGAPAYAADPTCAALVAALPASLEAAREFEVAVAVEQGAREVAYERSLVRREADGTTSTTVLERRGLRRPEAASDGGGGGGDGFALPCDDHDLDLDGGTAHLTLRDPDPEAVIAEWSLRFGLLEGAWRPLELVAPFEVRLLFVPVRGRFVTTFDGWRF
jgi:hypothetical protein